MENPFSPHDVGVLAAALPSDGGNPIGILARSIIVSEIKHQTPGYYPFDPGKGYFRSIFFPSYNSSQYESQIEVYTGLGSTFFADFSIVALCQAMYNLTSDLRKYLLPDKIQSDLIVFNEQLRSKIVNWYVYVASIADTDIRKGLEAFKSPESRKLAFDKYCNALSSDAWINSKVTQFHSGNWTNREWELFHHWIKLKLLGGDDSQIDVLILNCINKGLPVPREVGPSVWRMWTTWFKEINANDFDEATNSIIKYVGYYSTPRRFSGSKEFYGFVFTRFDGPGKAYRSQPPGSSCFSAGTMVLMSDYSLKKIEFIKPGEEVATPQGKGKVILVTTPFRNSRELFMFKGIQFSFTAAHPFLLFGKDAYASQDPYLLMLSIPSLAQFGIESLSNDNVMLCQFDKDGIMPFRPPTVEVDKQSVSDVLYDLLIYPSSNGKCEYFVGDTEIQVAVSTEIPRFLSIPETTEVLLDILEKCSENMLNVLEKVPDSGFADLLSIGLDSICATLLPNIGADLNREESFDLGSKSEEKNIDLVKRLIDFSSVFLNTQTNQYNWRIGKLLDYFISRFAPLFQASIRTGWRSLEVMPSEEATILAVTPYAFELFESLSDLPSDSALIQINLSKGDYSCNRVLGVMTASDSDKSYYASDEVAYFSEWRAIIDNPDPDFNNQWRLDLFLINKQNLVVLPFYVRLAIPSLVGCGFEIAETPIFDKEGKVCGRVLLDLRAMDSVGLEYELLRKRNWTLRDRKRFVQKLAFETVMFINLNFKKTIRDVRNLAVSESGFLADV